MGREAQASSVTGPRRGGITTAMLRDATSWHQVVTRLGLEGLVRRALRDTALTWMADSGVQLWVLKRVEGRQDPAVAGRHRHPHSEAQIQAGTAFSRWWA